MSLSYITNGLIDNRKNIKVHEFKILGFMYLFRPKLFKIKQKSS